MADKKTPDPRGHFVLYAKGHYLESHKTIKDLEKISRYCGLGNDHRTIIETLSNLVWQAFQEAPHPFGEFKEAMLFMYNNHNEIMTRYGPQILDSDMMANERLDDVLEEQQLKTMLVVLAKWRTEIELPEPDANLMSLRSPKKTKDGR